MAERKHEYRVGLVGYRGRGRRLAEYWQGVQGARLVAVADGVPEHREVARQQLGDISTYPLHSDMLEKEGLDIVTVDTGAGSHPPIVRDAIASGVRGIYMENPIADSLADADGMIEHCQAAGTVLTMGCQRRWSDQFRWLRDAIKDGAIGQPTNGYLYWSGGRVGSNGTHFLDAVNFALDSKPVEVAGTVGHGLDPTKTDDHPTPRTRIEEDPGALGFVTYANGFRLAIDGMNDARLGFTYMFCGTRGRIDLNEQGDWEIEYHARDADLAHLIGATVTIEEFFAQYHSGPVTEREPPALAPFDDRSAVVKGYLELLNCIETGARSSSPGEDGRMALEAIVAFHLSSEADAKPVSLPLPESARSFKIRTDRAKLGP